ncbi:phosphoesterase-like protein [Microdochium trichocladiopsis]|uniref:Phosphoesterase-like protein n=1 Tax=Microdochium trichocladiopsis TaxID=1682393 RepID=A0A9P9BSF2_9PEZI|nr:phosphoesterase-like protein [Microdochium trichocladiopsis]KAH7033673.1 phosphoesterase-like protein [Microdochium trichocladiopsis]
MFFKTLAVAALAGVAAAKPCSTKPTAASASPTRQWETAYTATAASDVAAAKATAKTNSPTSHVKGKVFDRYVSIWFENTNFEKAKADPNFNFFAQQGILLDHFFGVTHPSEPNYIASVAGDYFGMNNDDFWRGDFNVSTVFDLLDHKKISWSLYQEDMPFSGFEGKAWVNQKNGANDYVRKHNPAVIFDKVAHYEDKLAQIKNLSLTDPAHSQFHADLAADKLPQWMFITPNMTSDAHDTDVTTAGSWLRTFLGPLLSDPKFMQNTLVLITFDENEVYADRNQIFSVLLGDAVPAELHGTTDSHYYNHYSELATVQANWDLPTLGRWDVGANVYSYVAAKTGSQVRAWASEAEFNGHYWNASYAGVFYDGGKGNTEYPAPNLELDGFRGRPILEEVKKTWKDSKNPTYYTGALELPDGMNPPKGYAPIKA